MIPNEWSPARSSGAAPAAEAQFVSGVYNGDAVHSSALQDVALYVWGGRNYCWYGDGWHGPGYYWCGYRYRRGFGWGGGFGWHGWGGGRRVVVRRGGYHGGGYHGGGHSSFHGSSHGGGSHGGGGHHR